MPILTGETLFKQIENAIHFDRLKEKVSVEFVFVIDETGAVQDAKIMHGYSAKVDAIVLETLQKSSGKWKAPIACGVPVATALAQRYEYDPIAHRYFICCSRYFTEVLLPTLRIPVITDICFLDKWIASLYKCLAPTWKYTI